MEEKRGLAVAEPVINALVEGHMKVNLRVELYISTIWHSTRYCSISVPIRIR